MHYTAANTRRLLPVYDDIICDWPSLREQLHAQWSKLSTEELDDAWPDRHEIASLVHKSYGIPVPMVETYLLNVERRLPLL